MNKDFLMGDDGDILIKDGDLVVGESSEQEIIWILQQEKGWLKSAPLIGVGMTRRIRGPLTFQRQEIEKDIRINLKADGKNYGELKKMINLKLS